MDSWVFLVFCKFEYVVKLNVDLEDLRWRLRFYIFNIFLGDLGIIFGIEIF